MQGTNDIFLFSFTQLLTMHRESMHYITSSVRRSVNPELQFWKENCTDTLAQQLQLVDRSMAYTALRMFLNTMDEVFRLARASGLMSSASRVHPLPMSPDPTTPASSASPVVPPPPMPTLQQPPVPHTMPPPPPPPPVPQQQQQPALLTAEQWRAIYGTVPSQPPVYQAPAVPAYSYSGAMLQPPTPQPAPVQHPQTAATATTVQMRGTPPAGSSTPNTTLPMLYGDFSTWSPLDTPSPATPNTSLQD